MKKLTGFALILSLAIVATGCASGGGATSAGGTKPAATAPSGASFQVIPMAANEKAALAKMPDVVAEYMARKKKDAKIEGTDWLDVTGVTPQLVGYEVDAYVPVAGTDQITIMEIDYVNGRIGLVTSPDAEIPAANVEADKEHQANGRSGPENPGPDEKKALAAGKAWFAKNKSGTEWIVGVKRYLFLYRKGDLGVVIGTTLDGNLDRSSYPFELAK